MIDKRQTINNVAATLAQTIVLGGTLFFLYRYLLDVLGPEKLGVWSVVLASTSMTKIANLGLSGSVVKFVATYRARDDHDSVSKLLQTAMLAIGGAIGILLIGLYPFASSLLTYVIDSPERMADAIKILPYAFISVWLSAMYGVVLSGLDGFQRIDIRGSIMMGSAVGHAVLSYLLVGQFGLTGLAFAQLAQYLVTLAVALFFLRKLIRIPWLPRHWNSKLFMEMFFYGLSFQVMGFAVMLFDPVTKGLLAKFGGLSMVGYYELASRLVMQVRALVVSTNQVLVPAVADLHERAPEEVSRIYKLSTQAVFFVSVPVFALLFLCAPQIASLWLGVQPAAFTTSVRLLAVGAFFNTLVGPTFFIYLGTGRLRWNAATQFLIGALNLAAGWILGLYFGGPGVIAGWTFALSFGSIFLIGAYWVENTGSWRIFCSSMNLALTASGIGSIAALVYLSSFWQGPSQAFLELVAMGAVLLLLLGVPLWLHPFRTVTQNILASRLFTTNRI